MRFSVKDAWGDSSHMALGRALCGGALGREIYGMDQGSNIPWYGSWFVNSRMGPSLGIIWDGPWIGHSKMGPVSGTLWEWLSGGGPNAPTLGGYL